MGILLQESRKFKKKLHALGTALKAEVWCQESNNPFPPGSDLELRERVTLPMGGDSPPSCFYNKIRRLGN